MQDQNHDEVAKSINNYFLKGVISNFEHKSAVIEIEDSQKIFWPINNLPQECEKGTPIRLVLKTSLNDEEEMEKIAKTVLNKILKTDTKANGK